MTAAARELPAEFDDPRDALLDAAEEMIRRAVALGLEPQMRARLARLLPPPASVAAGQPNGGTGNRTASVDEVVNRSKIVTALQSAHASTRSPHQRAVYAYALAIAQDDFNRARRECEWAPEAQNKNGAGSTEPRHDARDMERGAA